MAETWHVNLGRLYDLSDLYDLSTLYDLSGLYNISGLYELWGLLTCTVSLLKGLLAHYFINREK